MNVSQSQYKVQVTTEQELTCYRWSFATREICWGLFWSINQAQLDKNFAGKAVFEQQLVMTTLRVANEDELEQIIGKDADPQEQHRRYGLILKAIYDAEWPDFIKAAGVEVVQPAEGENGVPPAGSQSEPGTTKKRTSSAK